MMALYIILLNKLHSI